MDRPDATEILYLKDGDEVICLVPFELDPELLDLDDSAI